MKAGKEAAFAEKHRAKQKAIRRFAKDRAYIFPGILAAAMLFGLFGATVGAFFLDDKGAILFGAFIGTWAGLIAANWLVMKGQK